MPRCVDLLRPITVELQDCWQMGQVDCKREVIFVQIEGEKWFVVLFMVLTPPGIKLMLHFLYQMVISPNYHHITDDFVRR